VALRARLQVGLDDARKRLGIPGVSATLIFRDGTTWTGTSGLADVKKKIAVTDKTAFAVGSISKTYTAAVILALAEERRVVLDAPAVRYLVGLPLDGRITVRMLLDHTSGLDDFFLHVSIDKALQAKPRATWPVAQTLRYVAKPYFAPGKGWHYSNTNYLYLGLIVEHVTGRPLDAVLRDRFFRPLGLDRTWYQAAEKPRAPTAHGYRFGGAKPGAAPIDVSDGSGIMPFTSVVTASGGAGSIAATSSDVATWARRLYTGEVLGPATTTQMLDGVASTAGYKPRVPYGLGVQAFPIDGRPTVGHSGRLLGFRAAVRHLPGEATTIAVLTNQSRADPGVIVRDLLSIVFAPAPPCFRCQTAN
jgi:D-alanyl-D-alanine carboxypeptidase